MKIDHVKELLPESIQTIAKLIGMARTIKLVEQLGGTTFPISKNQTRQGEIRFELLAEVIGVVAADVLTKHFGGEMVYIPSCADALRRLRNIDIITRFDLLSTELGANQAVQTLAREYHLSDRRIWKILKTTEMPSNLPTQTSLFGDD